MRTSTPLTPIGRTLPEHASYLARVRECFAATYERCGDSWTGEPAMRFAGPLLGSLLPESARVLDIGAGRGVDAALLAGLGHNVTAIDIVDVFTMPMVGVEDVVKGQLEFVQMDVRSLAAVGPAKFMGILDNGVLHHQHPADAVDYLHAVAQLLAPGGTYVVSLFDRTAGQRRDKVSPTGRLNLESTAEHLSHLLDTAGLRLRDTHVVEREDRPRTYLIAVVGGR